MCSVLHTHTRANEQGLTETAEGHVCDRKRREIVFSVVLKKSLGTAGI